MKSTHFLISFLLLVFSQLSVSSESAAAILEPAEQLSQEGYFNLRWNDYASDEYSGAIVQLEVASQPDFKSLLRSYPVTRSYRIALSGFSDGDYYFRLSDPMQHSLSNTVTVKVQHRKLSNAVNLFILGAVLFAILIASLIYSSTSQKHKNKR